MVKHVFLDANVYLSFFDFGKADIAELEKLAVLVENDEISLHTNDHLINEVERRRGRLLATSLEKFGSHSLDIRPPAWLVGEEAMIELHEKMKTAKQLRNSIVAEAKARALARELSADRLVQRLFDAGSVHQIDDGIIERANLRKRLGNPPGKTRDNIGDAVHWECMLAASSHQMSIVTGDGDFYSAFDTDEIEPFLRREWESHRSHRAAIVCYRTLREYLESEFPDIHLFQLAATDDLLDQLSDSRSFDKTHRVIELLQDVDSLTQLQMRRALKILHDNDQVNQIARDDDVYSFYMRFEHEVFWPPTNIEQATIRYLGVTGNYFEPF